ncbi:MAG: ABC transporter ATP-binding protein [Actinobacteria bacterium]|nr:MAG: ABC transporter ATP-binding protein [Actinomycetota bacterium]
MSLLAAKGVTKRFGGLTALDEVSFDLYEGNIQAIIGPNGAGKSTLFNVLTGFEHPEAGSVSFDGRDFIGMKPHDVCRAGVARTFQNTQLFDEMSALENVLAGRHSRMRTGMFAAALRLPGVRTEEALSREEAHKILRVVGLGEDAERRGADLPHGRRRLLEIARALASEPRVMLLDEPAAGLNSSETEALAEALYRIRDDGVTLLVVEHDMGLVMEISDEIVVLNEGRKIAEGPPRLIQKDPLVVQAYLGEEDTDA